LLNICKIPAKINRYGVFVSEKKIAIASDHGGFELKAILAEHLRGAGFAVADLGTNSAQSVDYPDYAAKMGEWITQNPNEMGILICGSGIGISIAANRNPQIRAALCHDGLSASLSRQHNNANVLCLGARLIGVDTAKDCVNKFLNTEFEGGRHTARVEKL
jgi:ribose 5-phosphate isomerase B